ncbi:MAG: sulfotransferase [Flavobacteriales bacterium]|nr:sulfotransferase [Flavobacteriales bacterium]
MTIEEINKIPFVFIVGRGRSGTTLLQNIIDANENAVLARESKIIIHLKNKYFGVKEFNTTIIEELISDLYKDRFFELFWQVNPTNLIKDLKSYPSQQLNFPVICKIIYLHFTSFFDKKEIKLIGDKNPAYAVFIPELLEVFPDAKFIHIIRDYRDNVVSNSKAFGEKSFGYLSYGWLVFNKKIEAAKKIYPNKFYTLRYEDLVNFPKEKTIEICRFLNLEFNEKMLNFSTKIEALPIELPNNHKNLTKPINNSQVGKYKGVLTKNELELIDFICGDLAKKYDYNASSKNEKNLYILKLMWYKFRYYQFQFIIKSYYLLPFNIRDTIRLIAEFLYKSLKIATKFNRVELKAKTNDI